MINILYKTLQIDVAYSVNSFIYVLKRLPILRDLFTDDIYKSRIIKSIVGLFGFLFSLARALFLKFMYFFVIYFISYNFFRNSMVSSFFHIYFCLTILGMFINNKLLNTSKKKYFSIILFNMDATKFFRANIFWNLLTSTIFNTLIIYIFIDKLLIAPTIFYTLLLIVFTLLVRIIGEALNIAFFKKYKYIWYTNSTMYFTILVVLLGSCLLLFFNISIPLSVIELITLLLVPIAILSFFYLMKIKDYKLIYKKLSQMTNVMDSKHEKDYLRQAMVEVRDRDREIDTKVIEKKEGYDLFNTIFFERHKEILLRSARKYSFVLIIIYILLGYIMLRYSNYNKSIAELLHFKLAIFIMIMFFINRGSIITQAMFFNCDHAMLRYNFYREPKVILELFKKRLLTVVKVNLLPAFVIGIGNISLLLISNNTYSILTFITTFLFILSLSIFFSVHYLVIYYLLQPFNKDMEVKKASYSFVVMLTYGLTYSLVDIELYTPKLALITFIVTILYTIISMFLIKKFAHKTFKLN